MLLGHVYLHPLLTCYVLIFNLDNLYCLLHSVRSQVCLHNFQPLYSRFYRPNQIICYLRQYNPTVVSHSIYIVCVLYEAISTALVSDVKQQYCYQMMLAISTILNSLAKWKWKSCLVWYVQCKIMLCVCVCVCVCMCVWVCGEVECICVVWEASFPAVQTVQLTVHKNIVDQPWYVLYYDCNMDIHFCKSGSLLRFKYAMIDISEQTLS